MKTTQAKTVFLFRELTNYGTITKVFKDEEKQILKAVFPAEQTQPHANEKTIVLNCCRFKTHFLN
jgi:hypothetical protein|tara:strand:- start:294 stop:488 length:195 start_codon:yes stop_codon:yes gene_type:complete